MRIGDRITRQRSSRYVWGGLTLLCAAVLVFALRAEQRALEDELEAANVRTVRSANTVIRDIVAVTSLGSTDLEFRFRDLLVAAQGEVFTDPTAARMRIWDLEGVLRFSTDMPRSEIGALQVTDDRVIAAIDGQASSTQTTEPFTLATTGRDGDPTRLLQTFVPLKVGERIDPLGAVQIDYLYDAFVENARDPWLQVQVVAAGLLGLFALLTVLSLRKPLPRTARIAAEPETATRETEVVSAGTASASSALDEELDLAREQLKQAEEAYHYLETRLKKTQEELARTGAAPGLELEEQIVSAQRDREMAEVRAELAEQRLAEMQRRIERLAPDPSAPPAVVQEAAPVANGAARRRPDEPPPGEPTVDASPAADAPAGPVEAPKEPVGAPSGDGEETPVSDAASELRARLARTAARKKLGPNVGE